MSDFEVRGADQFLKLSKALKDAGRTELRKELTKGMRVAAKPLVGKTRAAARAQLPKSGGLADQVAREPQRIQVRTGRDPGVRVVVARRRGGARSTNVGVVRHPVFADGRKPRNKWTWVNQNVRQGWFDDTLRAESPAIRRDLERALETVADNIVRETKRG